MRRPWKREPGLAGAGMSIEAEHVVEPRVPCHVGPACSRGRCTGSGRRARARLAARLQPRIWPAAPYPRPTRRAGTPETSPRRVLHTSSAYPRVNSARGARMENPAGLTSALEAINRHLDRMG